MTIQSSATTTWKGHERHDLRRHSAAFLAAHALFFASILLILIAGAISVINGPDNNWDLRYYHLYAPWAYLHDRYLFDIGPAQSQGFFNPASDFLFYAMISSPLNEFPRVIAFIMGAVHGINAVLILLIAHHVIRPQPRWQRITLQGVALLMGVTGMGFVSLLGLTTNDLINSIFVLGALLCVLKAAESANDRWRLLSGAGLFAGIAVGLKYTAAIFMPGLVLIAAVVTLKRRTFGGFVGFSVATLVGILAVAGPHMLTLWQDFGNPMFPFLNTVFQSPYYDDTPLADTRFIPHGFWQVLLYPFYWARTNHYLVSELAFRDPRGAFVYLALIVAAIRLAIARPRAMPHTHGLGLVIAFAVVSFFCWELCFGIYRYGVVIEMLTGVILVGALLWIFENRRLQVAVAAATFLAAAAVTSYPDWGHRPYTDRYIDVQVPQLPPNSIVLVATWEPVSYFIPYADSGTRFVGIENNYLELSQDNGLVSEVKQIMRRPGPSKFVLSVGEFDSRKLNTLLSHFGLKLSGSPCRPIRSNLEVHVLSLCPVSR